LRDDCGFAEATRSLTPFLAWLAARGRAWQATTLEDVTAYLASRPQWSCATIVCHVQSLRALFRHGATRGWCRAGLAETIDAPRLYERRALPVRP
jgi:site-specific recombinase XerD